MRYLLAILLASVTFLVVLGLIGTAFGIVWELLTGFVLAVPQAMLFAHLMHKADGSRR